jgi:hypothetical protein
MLGSFGLPATPICSSRSQTPSPKEFVNVEVKVAACESDVNMIAIAKIQGNRRVEFLVFIVE